MNVPEEARPGFDRRMTREEINALPIKRYTGPVEVVRAQDQLDRAVRALRGERVLGFDTETRPSFRKGETYLPSVIQLAGRRKTYVFQLVHVGFAPQLREILTDAGIIKAGVALRHDVKMLGQLEPFEPAGLVDLGDAAKATGIKNHGLRGLAAVLLGFRVSKSSQVSNWARADLSPSQIAYAATDAWVSRALYVCLHKMGVEMKPDGAGEDS